MGRGTTFGVPEGKRRWPVLRRFHAHNGSSPASFPRPQRQRRCAIQPGVVRVAALPRVLATSGSLPRKGLCRSCPPGGAGNKGGKKSGSRVRKRSPPGKNVQYPRNTHTSHATHSNQRRNPGLCGRIPLGFPEGEPPSPGTASFRDFRWGVSSHSPICCHLCHLWINLSHSRLLASIRGSDSFGV